MAQFAAWYKPYAIAYTCVFIARLASYDWQWLNCLYEEFGPENKPKLPFSIRCISTMWSACEMLINSKDINMEHPTLHATHYADNDAAYQAYMFLRLCHLLRDIKHLIKMVHH